ncbi:golgi reassembly stacking protein [Cordyceps fumosorosea ARSEF 2679]|uniref:Golgi reassembly stacking protein n=1 Tax=Cordyceps fumosorosea (strain ARSEF 2679) TaxID=1081104 RepID=A0A162MP75_CORFA|nr:golgi reassembly stacking protein [Cordyceps fumosorosea ARSEF 2679]OAA64810.1 golgi reassembly stacking protein [Cordyceps fumosorosea ARSEF 2679]
MFNALNRFMSRLDGGDAHQGQQERGSFGFQVLRNTNLQLAIEPWFDFVVGINGRPIDNPDPSLFAQEIRNCAGGNVSLGIWSAKGQRTREMHIPVPADTASLGLSLQYSPLSLAANIWHVLDVPTNSPADLAGLLPYSDYVLGSPEGALHGESALGELVEDFVGRPLRLHVYNNEYDVTREVTIQPSREWGGHGAIGCTLGYGALHRLPAPLSEPVDAPGETMFDGGHEKAATVAADAATEAAAAQGGDTTFLVPAQMVDRTASPAGGAPRAAKKKEKHGHASNTMMDDYFKEEEEKSRKLDNAPASKSAGVPPPPKAGEGPPRGPATTSPPATEEAA